MATIRNSIPSDDAAKDLSTVMSSWLTKLNVTDLFRTCASCHNLAGDNRTCSKFGAQPPVRVVVEGCEQYKDAADIPF